MDYTNPTGGTRIPKDQKGFAHANRRHGRKPIEIWSFRRFLVFLVQFDSLRFMLILFFLRTNIFFKNEHKCYFLTKIHFLSIF